MKEETGKNNTEMVEAGATDGIADVIGDVIGGVPAPIRKNAWRAFTQLCAAAIEIPASHLEGIVKEKRAETRARVKIIETGANQIADQMKVDPEYARLAVKKYGQKIVREQVNLDAISSIAAEELNNNDQVKSDSGKPVPDISEDWLNIFEKEACNKSSDEMRLLFGKILAGEIHRPSTYSIRTIRLLSQLDNQAAILFRTLCSLASTLRNRPHSVIDSRAISIGGNAALGSLSKYGLDYAHLNILQEHGLIIPEYNSWINYGPCVLDENNVASSVFQIQGKLFWLRRKNISGQISDLKMSGVALTKAGVELLDIVDAEMNKQYMDDLFVFFAAKGFECEEIPRSV
ncbi:MAG: DUF2806 domain-containing protein [Pseudohongiellaceae bacterium]